MSLSKKIANVPASAGYMGLLILIPLVILAAPTLLGVGLWLLGVPLEWSSWKTYAGLVTVILAVELATW